MTLEQKIKGMSTEQLADFLYSITNACAESHCTECPLNSGYWICDKKEIEDKLSEEVEA